MHKILSHIYYEVRKPKMTWEDVGGFEDIKAILKEMVCLPLTKGKELAEMNVDIPTGTMIWGPLGVGITMLAEAAAKEAERKAADEKALTLYEAQLATLKASSAPVGTVAP